MEEEDNEVVNFPDCVELFNLVCPSVDDFAFRWQFYCYLANNVCNVILNTSLDPSILSIYKPPLKAHAGIA